MDPLSSLMLRAALLWLLAGVVIGGAMLTDRALPGQWVLWMAPSHAHILFVGWFLQFAVGVAYWLLPRKRTPARPLGYGERAAFIADEKTVDAVVRNLEIVGEASKQIPEDFKALHPLLPWTQMAGLRNRIVHDYAGLDLELIWDIVRNSLPTLRAQFEGLA